MVFFLLEILNNIIQYQFDGNSNLIYTIIRKRFVFFNLLNLQVDQKTIDEAMEKKTKKQEDKITRAETEKHVEGGSGAKEAEPGTLKATLAEVPSILNMTEKTTSLQNKDDSINHETITQDLKKGIFISKYYIS